MKLRRTAALAAVLITTAAAVVPSTSAGAMAARKEWVCLVTPTGSGHELTLRRPSGVVDWLVAHTRSYRGPCAEYGERARLGDGELIAYSQAVGSRPVSVGLIMTDGSLDGLPNDPPTDGMWCFDKNGDATTDPMTECTGGYETQLELGAKFRREVDSPYTYVLANWNPYGHMPPGIYDLPHFDLHFYVNQDTERTAIRPGPCPHLVNCDDYKLGKRMPAAKYLAPDFIDLDAVEPGMGNHLIDQTAPEFNGEPFTHTWIYGVWDRDVTFYEAMVTHDWFDGLRTGTIADSCYDFKLPRAWQESGWYPTAYCLRHRANRGEVAVSLENFVHRAAS